MHETPDPREVYAALGHRYWPLRYAALNAGSRRTPLADAIVLNSVRPAPTWLRKALA